MKQIKYVTLVMDNGDSHSFDANSFDEFLIDHQHFVTESFGSEIDTYKTFDDMFISIKPSANTMIEVDLSKFEAIKAEEFVAQIYLTYEDGSDDVLVAPDKDQEISIFADGSLSVFVDVNSHDGEEDCDCSAPAEETQKDCECDDTNDIHLGEVVRTMYRIEDEIVKYIKSQN